MAEVDEDLLWQLARAIGENYDGSADPVETPNNWARAISAARDVKAVLLKRCQYKSSEWVIEEIYESSDS